MVAAAPDGEVVAVVVVREYDEKKDSAAVEQMENRCEVGPSGKLSLYTHLLGDPICRVRNSPAYLMLVRILVAEWLMSDWLTPNCFYAVFKFMFIYLIKKEITYT